MSGQRPEVTGQPGFFSGALSGVLSGGLGGSVLPGVERSLPGGGFWASPCLSVAAAGLDGGGGGAARFLPAFASAITVFLKASMSVNRLACCFLYTSSSVGRSLVLAFSSARACQIENSPSSTATERVSRIRLMAVTKAMVPVLGVFVSVAMTDLG